MRKKLILNFRTLNTRIYAGFSALVIVAISTVGFISLNTPDALAASSNLNIASASNPTPPSNAIYVNPSAPNGGTGTATSPLSTISSAISKSPVGGTIVLRGGAYRENLISVSKKLTIQAYPGEQAWLDGSDIISNWVTNPAGGFRVDNSPSRGLCKNMCVQDSSQIDANRNTMSSSPQMVFVNDIALNEVSSIAQATSGNNFFFDKNNNSLYIGVNPNGKKVEVTVRRKGLEFNQASSGSSLLGIGIRRFGSTLNTNAVDGEYNFAAVQISGNFGGAPITGITVENSTFTQNASRGLYLGYARNSRIVNNDFIENGANGFDINSADSIDVIGNLIASNNAEKFNSTNGYYAVIAGSKMVRLTNSVVKQNTVENNDSEGLWCDLECVNVKYYSNLIRNNTQRGIFYEISTGATIASNVIANNGIGIAIHGPNSKVYNNTLYKNGEGIGIYEDGRTPPKDPYSDNRSNTIVNNIIYGTNAPTGTKNVFGQYYKLLDIFGQNIADSAVPNQMVSTLDFNAYYREGTSAPAHVFGLSGNNVYQNFATFNSAKSVLNSYGFERNGFASDNQNDNPFINAVDGNMTVKSGSASKASAKLLNSPSDSYIANDLGLNPSSTLDRGAISWPGRQSDVIITTPTTTKPVITVSPTTVTPTTAKPTTTTTKVTTTSTTTTTLKPTTTTTKVTTTSTTTTTLKPTTTTTKVTTTSTTTTTLKPTTTSTTTTKLTATTTTTKVVIPPGVTVPTLVNQSNVLAMTKLKNDHDLQSIKQLAFNNNVLHARAYFKSSGFLYMAADVTANVQDDGSYTITGVNLLFSFGPFTY